MKIAILGFGIVGSGTYEVLAKSGSSVEVKRILDLRNIPEIADKLTTDINDILNDDEIEMVVETMGGEKYPYEYVTAAMKAGKNVVSSNKMLVAMHYKELIELAKENGVAFRFTAAAGGTIPWLSNTIRRTASEKILKIQAIINGTTNFILDSMQTRGADFAEVLAEAQNLGYAERDPSSDIDGEDIKFKCSISSSCAFGVHVPHEEVKVFPLRYMKKSDMEYASKMGMTIKYMTFAAQKENGKCVAYVEPSFISAASLEASVPLNYNMVSFFGEFTGRLSFYGQGAGKYPTGASVAADIIELTKTKEFGAACSGEGEVDNSAELHRYYVRTSKKIECVAAVAETYEANGEDFCAVTRELSVAEMHAIAEKVKAEDASAFFAGIHAEV
ncbi:MAG: homoserine dehydrogenase [Clostridia bacterium]|nr:homoserine dehydrogenase [Clostridia bacterium]